MKKTLMQLAFLRRIIIVGLALGPVEALLPMTTSLQAQSLSVESNANSIAKKAIEFFAKTGQAADGSFSGKAGLTIVPVVRDDCPGRVRRTGPWFRPTECGHCFS